MNPTLVGTIVFACTFGGALLGFWLQKRRKHELDLESTETIRHSIGVVATMTALILGLVTASAKSSFDEVTFAVESGARDVLTLDRLLARYGSETSGIRTAFKDAVAGRIDMVWPQGSSQQAQLDPSSLSSDAERLAQQIRALTPRNDSQRWFQARAGEIAEKILEARWLASAYSGASVSGLFLVVLLFWLTITFVSYGLVAARNSTVVMVLFLCAVSAGSALFLILEMDGPFVGMLKVSADPMHFALAHLNLN
jgi:hypothetical protein